jgi:hypothetical protein
METDGTQQHGRTCLDIAQVEKRMLTGILFAILVFFGIMHNAYAFTPGEGGHITDVTFTSTPNMIGCLYITTNHRGPSSMSGGSIPQVDFSFPVPSTYGATGVTLQYADIETELWKNYQHNGSDVTTDGDNFSIEPDGDYRYRLLFNGGPVNGKISNVVEAVRSTTGTRFSAWEINEGMWLSGIMMPWVGRGLEASFTVATTADGTPVTEGLTYQWYRVNPVTYERTAIPGATSTKYTTTMDDVGGFQLFCRATGDGINIGGFAQVKSSSGTIIPNLAYVTNVSKHKFTLNLQKSIDSLPTETLTLSYQDTATWQNIDIDITNVTKIAPAIYEITAEIPSTHVTYYLQNSSNTWRIAEEMATGEFHELREGVSFTAAQSSFMLFLPAIIGHRE